MRKEEFFAAHDPRHVPLLQEATIGIAGCGGLGSTMAVSLTRVGIGRLILADFDKIEASNLNRQQFFRSQIGLPKVQALADNLQKISLFTSFELHQCKLDQINIPEIFESVDVMIEAFDKAEMKQMIIESWLQNCPSIPLITASGLAGFGKNELLHTRKIDNLYLCGDETSELTAGVSPMAPRVGIVANMQANLAVQLILDKL
jgi:sulfur carrier protein ThiS adenylyltransferase